jgi:hypothetical protein
MDDLLIRHGHIVDGTGSAPSAADVGVNRKRLLYRADPRQRHPWVWRLRGEKTRGAVVG